MFGRLFRNPAKFAQVPQEDDGETLLPSSSTASFTLQPFSPDRYSQDVWIAAKTTLICTILYTFVGLWIGLSLKAGHFVVDKDEFCLRHISHYCKWRCLECRGI